VKHTQRDERLRLINTLQLGVIRLVFGIQLMIRITTDQRIARCFDLVGGMRSVECPFFHFTHISDDDDDDVNDEDQDRDIARRSYGGWIL